MKLNLEYFNGIDDISEEEKDKLEGYLNENNKLSFEEYINKDKKIENLLELSNLRENLLNWYPFKENSNILEIESNLGEITGVLCQNGSRIVSIEHSLQKARTIATRYQARENLEVIVGNINDIILEEKFDYVVVTGIDKKRYKLEEILKYAKEHLKEEGTILISLDNKLGLNQLNGIEDVTINQNKENQSKTKTEIEKILKKSELNNYKLYYPLPNYKTPNIIFTDKHLPSNESILRDLTLYTENRILSFEEREIYRKILKEDIKMFPEFANSFLIEISNSIQNEIEYISFGNSRKEEYRLKTVLLDKIAYKQNVNEKSKEHLEKIKRNIEILKNSNINVLDSFEDDKIISNLVKNEKSLDKNLVMIFKEKGQEEGLNEIVKFKNELENKLEKSEENCTNVFQKYNIETDEETKSKLNFIKYGIFDLIFQNCFVINNEYYFYDQEWIEENIPLEFIIYRAVTYLCNSEKDIDSKYIFEKLEIDKYIETFDKLETILQEQIKDDIIWKVHAESHKTIKNMYDTFIHERNLEAGKTQEKLNELWQIINAKNETEQEYIKEIQQKNLEIGKLSAELDYIKNSKSWKVTKPFRNLRGRLKNN